MRTVRAAIATLAAVGVTAALAVPGGAAVSPNLIKNPGVRQLRGRPVRVRSWRCRAGRSATVPTSTVVYGTGGGFPGTGDVLPTKHGKNFLAGGPNEGSTTEVAVQTISLKPYLTAIQAGTEPFNASAWLGGFDGQSDNAEVEIDWKHGTKVVGASVVLGPVTVTDRGSMTGFLQRTATGTVPSNANHAFVQIIMNPFGGYNDGYADNLSLTLGS